MWWTSSLYFAQCGSVYLSGALSSADEGQINLENCQSISLHVLGSVICGSMYSYDTPILTIFYTRKHLHLLLRNVHSAFISLICFICGIDVQYLTHENQLINICHVQWSSKWKLKLWTLHLRDSFKLSLYYSTNPWKYNVPWFYWNRGFYLWWGCQIKSSFSRIQSLSLTLYRKMCLAFHAHSPLQNWWWFSDAAVWICAWILWKSAVDKLEEWLRLDTPWAPPLLWISEHTHQYVHFILLKMSSPNRKPFFKHWKDRYMVTLIIFSIFQFHLKKRHTNSLTWYRQLNRLR